MNIKQLEKILESDLNLGHFYVLNLIYYGDNELKTSNVLINGWINVLIKKSLILNINNNYELTEKGKEQLFNIIEETNLIQTNEQFVKELINNQTLEEFSNQLHAKISLKIKELTGKTSFINPSGSSLNSSKTDVYNRLIGFFKKYKKENVPFDKIEKVILKYVEDAINKNIKLPVRLIYYMWNEKSGGVIQSPMLTDIENLTNEKEIQSFKNGVDI